MSAAVVEIRPALIERFAPTAALGDLPVQALQPVQVIDGALRVGGGVEDARACRSSGPVSQVAM